MSGPWFAWRALSDPPPSPYVPMSIRWPAHPVPSTGSPATIAAPMTYLYVALPKLRPIIRQSTL